MKTVRSKLDPKRLKIIAGWMQRYVDDRKYPGSSILIHQHGQEAYFHACGLRSVEQNLPFERNTLARIYSMTKPITSVALMTLAERGLFHLDAPVSEFIPEFKDMQALVHDAERLDQVVPCATPTLHQLLTHTSGLSYPFNPGVLARAMDEQEILFKPDQGQLADMARQVAKLPLAFAPGSRWEYSVSIDIIGRIIEVVTGKSFENMLQAEIFEPLGMTETGFRVKDGAGNRFASLYTPLAGDAMALNDTRAESGNTLRLVDEAGTSPFETATMHSGGGGLVGTIDDYARFSEMLRQGGTVNGHRIIGSRTLNFMMRNHLAGDIASMGPQSFAEQPMEGMGFGLGGAVVLDPALARCPGSVGDFSWGGMASTFFWLDRQHDMTVVFFTQLSPSSSYPSRAELKALVQGALS